jgi:hypothetical protein
MAQTHLIQLSEAASQEITAYAAQVGLDPESMAEELVVAGFATLRRLRYFEPKPEKVDVSEALEILSRAGKGNAPDPGDEIPSDLQHVFSNRSA